MENLLNVALNADTTPLSISDTLVFKPLTERAQEAHEAGFTALNVDRSEEGLTPEKAKEILDLHQLDVASGFFQGHLYNSHDEGTLYREALQQARFSEKIGQKCLFVSAYVSPPERHALAGRVHLEEPVSLTNGQFNQMVRFLERIAKLWKDFGIDLCYHPHVATYIEAPHEIERLMGSTDPDLVKFGPDTGHLLFGGGNPISMVESYMSRLGAIHIKDVKAQILEEVRRKQLDYRQACGMGVWTEIGTGNIDFPALFTILRKYRWSGWVIVETDHTLLPTAVESSKSSRRYLREVIGI